MKSKIIEALSAGLPVITTPVGIEGMGLRNGKDVIVAGKAGDFAEAAISLYNNEKLWNKISKNGYNAGKRLYDFPIMEEGIERLIAGF